MQELNVVNFKNIKRNKRKKEEKTLFVFYTTETIANMAFSHVIHQREKKKKKKKSFPRPKFLVSRNPKQKNPVESDPETMVAKRLVRYYQSIPDTARLENLERRIQSRNEIHL